MVNHATAFDPGSVPLAKSLEEYFPWHLRN